MTIVWPVDTKAASAFSHQLAALLATGVPIPRAVTTLARMTSQGPRRRTLQAVARDLQAGASLAAALAAHPRFFPATLVAMVHAGEATGRLGALCTAAGPLLQHEARLRSRVHQVLVLPLGQALWDTGFFPPQALISLEVLNPSTGEVDTLEAVAMAGEGAMAALLESSARG